MTALVVVASLCGLFLTFVGYPLAIGLRARLAPRPVTAADWEPAVDVVLVAHDAEAEIDARLDNLLQLDYRARLLRIHAASDGSSDGTVERLERRRSPRLAVHAFPSRRGKSACIGDLLPSLDGDVVLFVDVRQRIEPGAVRALLRPLADPTVGAVSGELMFEAVAGDVAGGIDAYWRYEKFIRRSEAESGSVVGVTGALYAARRSLLPQVPAGLILDDLWIPLQIAARGARVVFASDAIAWDRPSTDAATEARRKRRTLAGNYQLIAREPSLLLPWKHPLGWRLWGHKWLRLAAPWLLVALFLATLRLAPSSRAMTVLLLAQVAFYAAAVAGLLVPRLAAFAPVRIAATFLRMNGYAALALLDFVSGRADAAWSITRQNDSVLQ